jgi:phosphoribosylformylglycinamidine synthase I
VKWGVVVFPGSNDDRDTEYALATVLGGAVEELWHRDTDLKGCDAIVLPGGFSYGDYLRCGAIAGQSPIMGSVRRHAAAGGAVLGICNGFQVLCESGLLPGALVRNSDLRFQCRVTRLRVESTATAFSAACDDGEILEIPVKNGEGNYVAPASVLERLEAEGRVVFRYVDGAPNGSAHDIAGVANEAGNVVGLMPHPEHAVDPQLGGTDGQVLFRSVAAWLDSRGENR